MPVFAGDVHGRAHSYAQATAATRQGVTAAELIELRRRSFGHCGATVPAEPGNSADTAATPIS